MVYRSALNLIDINNFNVNIIVNMVKSLIVLSVFFFIRDTNRKIMMLLL